MATRSSAPDPLARHMPAVARALLGEPNPDHSKPDKPRWGTHGSLSVDEKLGIWFDHETKQGGGVLDFIRERKGLTDDDAFDWMKLIGCRIDGPSKINGAKTNGAKHSAAKSDEAKKEIAETYDYLDEAGERSFQVVRFVFRRPDGSLVLSTSGKPGKTFHQRRPDPDNPKAWVWGLSAGEYMRKARGHDWYRFDEARWTKLPASRERKTIAAPARSVPYRLPDVIETVSQDRTVFVVEGEQKAAALAKWNLVATCNAEGAGKWTAAHAAYLRGADVVILPDNDDPGRAHADAVAKSLTGIASRVRVLKLPDLAPKGDIVDWQKAGGTREQLDALVANAAAWQKVDKPDDSSTESATDPQDQRLESSAASTFEMRAVHWLWPNRFAQGKIGLIGGLPDRGKGLICSDIMARVTNGDTWPCDEGRAPLGNVLLLTAEDDIEDTVIPRLRAAGAHLDRVHLLKMVRKGDKNRQFNLVTDLPLLQRKIAEVGNVKLTIIDPMSSYLGVGMINSHRTSDVRGVLAPLKDLAETTKVSILGIMHFNKKADVTNAMLRISDSLAFVAASRHCYVVVDDQENERRLFVKAKNNLAPDTKALSYTIGLAHVGKDPENMQEIWSPHVIWGPEHVNVTATEAMEAEANAKSPQSGARDEAKDFLAGLLAGGPVPKAEIEEAAEGNGIAERTLFRAKADLGVVARKDGMRGGWVWEMPAATPPRHEVD